ncbi:MULTISPECIES: type II toxin-antitoxin system RelE/ParE family toxin [Pseudomonas]|uniref:Type II toxin-antitoxin system RelE/ParE family toxin n=1 Tax=Pseudomonas tritici TaxID=2745518 RepID=A0A8H9YS65_9PSED|nr:MULTISPECIES: type II toxin-antitoxin system RelE/ParE family toxin [Pseudomonas]MBP2874220.1 type II toxin-antitoxin system RelE/ParE family toxin [Pseudomonas sp. SWRI144]MBW8127169.1 type II toxin-antitoxin system RelE/ParE family toxin [Pseudomonas sp. LAP_36]MBW8134810.1 type II toxin-antitoxin system RelE/ParE family toxin [Pseudomonas sp. PAMC 26818]QXH81801.1 type II toxin-antitoxin system RelE/ParE family toxin [Pseudomonas tritici]CRM08870.1 Toxin HigB-2 [Pseudomonas sp. 52 E 6]
MIFIETAVFTRRVTELMNHDAYLGLQVALMFNPCVGDVIEGTGGIRKLRIASKGHGKRGGARVIYYHFVTASKIALLMIYPKNEQQDLTNDERKALKAVIEHWR